jgi:hypothetical protein
MSSKDFGGSAKSEAARNAHRNQDSLQDTNICSSGRLDQCGATVRALKESNPGDWLAKHDKKWMDNHNIQKYDSSETKAQNQADAAQADVECENSATESKMQCEDSEQTKTLDDEEFSETTDTQLEKQYEDNTQTETLHNESAPMADYVPHTDNDLISHGRGNTEQKEADYAGTSDMSIQMYRYMRHNDMKRKILDLSEREDSYASKYCWDEALRLREMKNKLNLLKLINLFENHDLKIEEETRKVGLKVIEAIDKLNKQRANINNTNMYSDGAKELWKQWVHEDNDIANIETNAMRDLRLAELEEEWKDLALRDKNRVSQLTKEVFHKSDLPDEEKLVIVIQHANGNQKQYMEYIAT